MAIHHARTAAMTYNIARVGTAIGTLPVFSALLEQGGNSRTMAVAGAVLAARYIPTGFSSFYHSMAGYTVPSRLPNVPQLTSREYYTGLARHVGVGLAESGAASLAASVLLR